MIYDQELVRRVRKLLDGLPGYEEKNMFGGLVFLIDGTVACGVLREELIVRTGPPKDYAHRPLRTSIRLQLRTHA